MDISKLLKLEHTNRLKQKQKQKDHTQSYEMDPTGTEARSADQEISQKKYRIRS
jgi:hypothetical protein